MEIYLVRHTTPKIDKGICYGQSDLDTAASFALESKEILKKINFDSETKIYSSTSQRCTQLATLFNPNFKQDKRILEMNFGEWELKKWDDIPTEEMTPWMTNFVHVKVPNGESYVELDKRANAFFNEVLKKGAPKSIIVCHAGVIRSILARLTETVLKDSFNIKIIYGQVSKITINETTEVQISI
jgi:alpha-ribazole phosphatase